MSRMRRFSFIFLLAAVSALAIGGFSYYRRHAGVRTGGPAVAVASLPATPKQPAPTATAYEPTAGGEKDPLIVILAPHFDDGALSLGGLLARDGTRSTVITFFAGEPTAPVRTTWDSRSGFGDSHEAMVARARENAVAMASLHAAVENLGYLDYQYRPKAPTDDIEKRLAADIEAVVASAIKKGRPVNIFAPALFEPNVEHPDHKLLHEAFVKVAAAHLGNATVAFYLYEDFPYMAHETATFRKSFLSFLEKADGMNYLPEYVTLTAEQMDAKVAAVLDYKSQRRELSSGDIGSLVRSFDTTRCPGLKSPFVACEMTYRLPDTAAVR